MKLSELSKRDYIAIEVLGKLAGPHTLDKDAVWRAYGLADAMIAFEGKPKRDAEFEDMKTRLEAAERSNEILRQMIPKAQQAAGARQGAQWEVVEALENFLKMYVAMVNSGDCGNWDPETDVEVIQARAALARIKL